jgi:hypothetical protein
MLISYKWSIVKVQVEKQFDGKSNVVTQAEWLCQGADTANNLTANVAGTKKFALGDTFTDYKQLTEEQVLAWCTGEETVSVKDEDETVFTITRNLKNNVEQQIATEFARQIDEKASETKLPWLTVALPA